MLRRILATAIIAGFVAGVALSLVQSVWVAPLILHAETYEVAAAAATGEPWLGAVLLCIFGLARGVPLLLAGTATGMVKHLRQFSTWVPMIERASGSLMLLASLYFLYQTAAYAGLVTPFQFLFG